MSIGTILLALVVFGVLIFVHELGHYLAARWAGVQVNEFALGMGPKVFSFTKGETRYSLRLLPLGGFCAMEGEDEDSYSAGSFNNAALPKRVVVMAAGAAMNLLLGLIILTILTTQLDRLGSTTVAGFKESAVSSSQLMSGDKILRLNNRRVWSDNDMIYEFMRDRDGVMDILVERQGEKVLLPGVAFQMRDLGEGMQGIYIDFTVYGVEKTVPGVIFNSINWTGSLVKQVWGSLIDLITGRYGLNQLSGPVGVTTAIGEVSSQGLRPLLMLVAFITVNLGVFNLLPLPALDGGRLIFLFLEAIRRKPINPKYEGVIHAVGFMLIMGLVIFATVNDVARLV